MSLQHTQTTPDNTGNKHVCVLLHKAGNVWLLCLFVCVCHPMCPPPHPRGNVGVNGLVINTWMLCCWAAETEQRPAAVGWLQTNTWRAFYLFEDLFFTPHRQQKNKLWTNATLLRGVDAGNMVALCLFFQQTDWVMLCDVTSHVPRFFCLTSWTSSFASWSV